jgi:hypothetical protein
MRSRSTIEFLGLWEKLNNPGFKLVEFDQFRSEAGANYFVLSPEKWIETTNAIGLISRSGNKGGTYAHKDIAFEFASWISPQFKLYLIKEFQRLKDEERKRGGRHYLTTNIENPLQHYASTLRRTMETSLTTARSRYIMPAIGNK